jgi:type II secretory pathway component GspD/PulD (secretin)
VRSALILLLASGILVAAEPAQPGPSTAALEAKALLDAGKAAEAEAAAEARLKDAPDDQGARKVLLAARIARSESELRGLLAEQGRSRDLLLGDNDFDAAKARADADVRRRLDTAEGLLSLRRYGEAVEVCNAILADHPHEPAAMRLKYAGLTSMVERERGQLKKEIAYRHSEAINDADRDAVFPRDKPRVKRQVFVFDEDMDELERQRVRNRLQEVISLDLHGTQARPVLEQMFAVAGINYVILDSAIGEQTLTIRLLNETVETALDAVAKMVKLRYSYVRGTVFISGEDDGQLVTEIIRLKAGLTDVDAVVTAGSLSGSTPGSGTGPTVLPNGAGLGSPTGINGAPAAPANPFAAAAGAGGAGAAGGAGGGKSDIERFIEKIPDIVVGWPSEGKVYLDRKSNTVYVRATPHAISEVKRLISALDYNSVQVLIEARFIEVAESAMRTLGVSWQVADAIPAAAATWNGVSGVPVQPGAVALPPDKLGGMVFSGLTQAGKANVLATLTALEEEGKSTNLAEPKILTLNNARGLIEITREITYISGYTNQGTGQVPVTTGNTTTYVQQTALVPQFAKENEGISLSITPSVARNSDIITLRLEPKVKVMTTEPKDVKFNITGNDGKPVTNTISQPPEFTTRSLVTSLHVQNGQSVALGGLVNKKQADNTEGIPFLMKIPLLGQFFRTDVNSNERRNLIILVTANQVEPSGAKVADEVDRLRDTARVLIGDEARKAMESAPLAPQAQPLSAPQEPRRWGGKGGGGKQN